VKEKTNLNFAFEKKNDRVVEGEFYKKKLSLKNLNNAI
jgi:hypothetical protein